MNRLPQGGGILADRLRRDGGVFVFMMTPSFLYENNQIMSISFHRSYFFDGRALLESFDVSSSAAINTLRAT